MFGKIGKYTLATLEYGGIKMTTAVKKSFVALNEVTDKDYKIKRRDRRFEDDDNTKIADTLNYIPRLTVQTGKYTYAAVEYAGLMIYILLKKGSQALASPEIIAMRSKGKFVTNIDEKTLANINNVMANLGKSAGNFFRRVMNADYSTRISSKIGDARIDDSQLKEMLSRIETMLSSANISGNLNERLGSVESNLMERLESIEAKLRNIEENGTFGMPAGSAYKQKNEVKEDAKLLLASILQANLELR